MEYFNQTKILDGITLIKADANRFKTNELSISFALPLSKKTASANALLISLLSHCSAKYPDMQALNTKLAMLYGANLRAFCAKAGENQTLNLAISVLDDRFSIDKKSISAEAIELLLSLVFYPRVDENGNFYEEDIDREKRLLIEKIESENNEKRLYALNRLTEEMFKEEPYSVNPNGSIEEVKKISNESLKNALECFKKNAKIQITSIGMADDFEIIEKVKDIFSSVKREYVSPVKSVFKPQAEKIQTVEERQNIKQGKLVLGFRVNLTPESPQSVAMRAFCDVFGGGPYSKLFMNVREKLSLCYYCSARYEKRKSCIIIQCGCEEENMEEAVNEILNQLEDIKNGNFETEFEASKIGLSDMLRSASDDPLVLLSWYVSQISDDEIISPEQSAQNNEIVSFDEIKNCANLITLDTVFKLMSVKEEGNEC